MWMMGYNDGGEFNSIQDPFTGRRLRPLMPMSSTTTQNPFLSRIHGTDFLALNHHLAMADQSKEFGPQHVVVSSRWNPTPEQLQTLEELYRRGTRTPSAEQIQHITAQLRRYGKIEGKNVFYWFQNHKARERQKRRRQLESFSDEQSHNNMENGANRTRFQVEQAKNRASPTNSGTNADQRTVSGKAAGEAEPKADGWVQFTELELELELQQRKNLVERNATWRMMHLPCSSSPTNQINSTPATNLSTSKPRAQMDPNPVKPQDFNISTAPYNTRDINSWRESQTLELFPLRGAHENDYRATEKDMETSDSAMDANFSTSYHFFEFLPLKK